jgi:hypothetical protein
MDTAAKIIEFVGPDTVKSVFAVKDRRLNQCRQSNVLPASWYDALERMAGRPLPRHLFSFKGTSP